jgi:hypothetical protein
MDGLWSFGNFPLWLVFVRRGQAHLIPSLWSCLFLIPKKIQPWRFVPPLNLLTHLFCVRNIRLCYILLVYKVSCVFVAGVCLRSFSSPLFCSYRVMSWAISREVFACRYNSDNILAYRSVCQPKHTFSFIKKRHGTERSQNTVERQFTKRVLYRYERTVLRPGNPQKRKWNKIQTLDRDFFQVQWGCDLLCGLVFTVPCYRSRGPSSIPCATRFSEK